MRIEPKDPSPPGGAAPLGPAPELGEALSHGLGLPVTALRVFMESLSRELSEQDPGRHHLEGALQEVERLGRNVRDLLEFASPHEPMPLWCTADEVVYSARGCLKKKDRSRLTFARSVDVGEIFVDGPLLSRSLQRLIENAFEAGSASVLISVRKEGRTVSFSVVDEGRGPRRGGAGDAGEADGAGWATAPFRSTKPNHLGLGLALTCRDVGLMGGTLELARARLGGTRATVSIPVEPDQAASR